MNEFYTVLTQVGLDKDAAARAGGPPIALATIHAGDGGGPDYYDQYDRDALEALVDLVNEVWSAPLNNLETDPENPNWVIAEGVIPADVGGFMVREVGIKDTDGDLIAIGRFPATYKPNLTDGAAQDLLLRNIMEVSNVESVTLEVDPAVALASQSFVKQYAEQYIGELLEEEDPAKALASKGYTHDYVGERLDTTDPVTETRYKLVIVDGALAMEEI